MQAYKSWPNGKKVAVTISVMYETWAERTAPTYSVHAQHAEARNRRSLRTCLVDLRSPVGNLAYPAFAEPLGSSATVFLNSRCAELSECPRHC